MKVSLFGLGYVGVVSSACLARDGHTVIGVDISDYKVETINSGRSPILEPGLEELVWGNVESGRLKATTDACRAVAESDVSLICVGTPSDSNGNVNLRYLEGVCRDIGRALAAKAGYHVVVVRSTVLPDTVEGKLLPILEQASGKRAGADFGLCNNPEFLREGCAIADYDRPELILIGEFDRRAGDVIEELYKSIEANVVRTTIKTAEMVKYVSNAYHALKVVFANEIGTFCKTHGIDGRDVMEIFCQDRRLNISNAYFRPGFAFGGSCLPKDVRALLYRSKQQDLNSPLLNAVMLSNQLHLQRGIEMIERKGKKKIGVFGLSFKAGTDDVRESPMVPVVETLVGRGYDVCLYDANVQPDKLIGANRTFLERELPHIASLMRPTIEEVVDQSEVLVIGSGAKEFERVLSLARHDQAIVDLTGIDRNSTAKRSNYEGICW